ncbi:MAG TPA: Ig-like domain-containing protein, partial [Ilumatobacteraceae bacterium]
MSRHPRLRKRLPLILAGTAVACAAMSGTAGADPFGWWTGQGHGFETHNDIAIAGRDGIARGNVLANDFGATGVVRNSALDDPAAGSLVVKPDGTFTFTPTTPGSHGTVKFTYSATDALSLYQTDLPPLDTFGTVKISGGSFGSS